MRGAFIIEVCGQEAVMKNFPSAILFTKLFPIVFESLPITLNLELKTNSSCQYIKNNADYDTSTKKTVKLPTALRKTQ